MNFLIQFKISYDAYINTYQDKSFYELINIAEDLGISPEMVDGLNSDDLIDLLLEINEFDEQACLDMLQPILPDYVTASKKFHLEEIYSEITDLNKGKCTFTARYTAFLNIEEVVNIINNWDELFDCESGYPKVDNIVLEVDDNPYFLVRIYPDFSNYPKPENKILLNFDQQEQFIEDMIELIEDENFTEESFQELLNKHYGRN